MPEIPGVRTFRFSKIIGREHCRFGSHVIIDDFVFIYATDEHVIGDYTHIASFTSITGGGKFFMADFAGIASGCRILTGTDEFLGAGLTGPCVPEEFRQVLRGQVRIGKFAVVGANAVVLPNVSIGTGTVVGAGSVVTSDLAPWGLYVGSPARRIRERPRKKILELEERLREEHG